jgi:glutamate-5-semialdehyde dehydrogenase
MSDLQKTVTTMAQKAKAASRILAAASTSEKNRALKHMAKALIDETDFLIKENRKDLKAAEAQNYSKSLVERLVLNAKRIHGMADCLLDTAKLKDPVGEVMETYTSQWARDPEDTHALRRGWYHF